MYDIAFTHLKWRRYTTIPTVISMTTSITMTNMPVNIPPTARAATLSVRSTCVSVGDGMCRDRVYEHIELSMYIERVMVHDLASTVT